MSLSIINSSNIFQKDVIGNVRKAQEDSHDIALKTPNGDVFVVCDGMGGHVGGKQASSIAVKSIIEYLKKEEYPQPMQALNDALQFANMQILGYANEHPELKGMGTTACIVLLQETEAFIAHVGDSRIYLYLSKEKQLHRITKDHSFVQTLVDAGQITDEEAEHHPNKNRILKALGIKPDMAPSIDRVQPKNGDVFLICSDGLSGMISDFIIKDVLTKGKTLEEKGDTLISLALEAGGFDNITLELIQIAGSPHAQSVFRSYNPISNDGGKDRARIIRRLMIVLFAIVVCLVISGIFVKVSQIQNKKQKINRYETEIQELEKELQSTNNSISTITEDNQGILILQHDINSLKNPDTNILSQYQHIITENKKTIDSLQNKKEDLEKKIQSKKDSLDILKKEEYSLFNCKRK